MSETVGKKLFSIKEAYIIAYSAFCSMPEFRHAKINKLLNQQFIERIMLAVTEVNGCAVCSYAHTKMALEAGMSNEEIQKMLAGINDDVHTEEMPAIMFAQHYADYRGHPSENSWERVVDEYGLQKAKGILGAIRIIMMGNAYGIPWSSFFYRFKGKPDKRSNLIYELGIIFSSIFFMPVALIHSFLTIIKEKLLPSKKENI